MSRTRGGHRPGCFRIAVLAVFAFSMTVAACTSVNNQNGSNCSNQGNGNGASCSKAVDPGSHGPTLAGNGPQASSSPVQLLGSDAIFTDPKVESALAKQGFTVQSTLPGSRSICGHPKAIEGYDFSDTSAPQAPCYEDLAQKDGKTPGVAYPYTGLMVIATYKPIVALLGRLHIVSEIHGVTVFNVAKYLQVFNSGKRWTGIPGNTAYPNRNRILLWTTDPKNSNLGGMLADLAYAAQNNDDEPVKISSSDPRLKVIKSLYTELGGLDPYSGLEVGRFFSGGMGTYPMAMMYESQYLSSIVTKQATNPNLTFMYPTPDATVADAMVGFTTKGKELISAVQSAPVLKILESEGYRTERDESGFTAAMARQGLTVPSLDNLEQDGVQFSTLPTDKVLTELINAVAASQT